MKIFCQILPEILILFFFLFIFVYFFFVILIRIYLVTRAKFFCILTAILFVYWVLIHCKSKYVNLKSSDIMLTVTKTDTKMKFSLSNYILSLFEEDWKLWLTIGPNFDYHDTFTIVGHPITMLLPSKV